MPALLAAIRHILDRSLYGMGYKFSLQYSCMHTNGSEIDVDNYIETIPFFVCQTHFTSCVTANPDSYNQVLCREQYACGIKTASASTTPTKSRTVLPRPTATGLTTSIPSGTSSEPDEVKVASSMATAIVKSNKIEIMALGIVAASL